mmetsp:Transcript_70035/g.167977  ORF Transcript_70035/g.167977 Transcript_70035/m.167977 type:complete len:131 (+) Transcript_70035:112-504(+)
MDPLQQASHADQVIFLTKQASEQNFLFQRLCMERCIDAMQLGEATSKSSGSGAAAEDSTLPPAASRCADICVNKLFDTSNCVAMEMQSWQEQAARQQQMERLAGRTILGMGGLALAGGVCWYLFRGGGDE